MTATDIIRRMLCMAALAALLTGCVVDRSDRGEQKPAPGSDLIELSAEMSGVNVETVTKAPVEYWKNTKVTFGYGKTANSYDIHWDGQIITHGSVIFSPVRAYSADFSRVHLKGFHPRGEVRDGDYNTVYFTLSGQEDLMVTQNLDMGTLDSKNRDVIALFSHKLAQFTFTVVNDPDTPYPPISKIKKLVVYAADSGNPLQYNAALDLRTNNVSYLPGGAGMVGYDSTMGDGISLIYGETKDAIRVMFQPGKKIRVHTEYTTSGDAIAQADNVVDIVPLENTSYEIVLRFTGTGITIPSVSIIDWSTGYLPSGQGSSSSNPIIIW